MKELQSDFSNTTQTDKISKIGTFVVPVLMTLVIFFAGFAGLYSAPKTGEVAIVFPIGHDEITSASKIIDAGGGYIGATRLPNVFVAYSYDVDFQARLRERGALFFLSAVGLCAVDSQKEI